MPKNQSDLERSGQSGVSVSRRSLLRQCVSGAILVGTGVLTTACTTTKAQAKVSKSVAQYRSHPNKDQRCGLCVHYRFPGSCELVQGPVSLFGWCRFFKAR
jgi:hypothetical protein